MQSSTKLASGRLKVWHKAKVILWIGWNKCDLTYGLWIRPSTPSRIILSPQKAQSVCRSTSHLPGLAHLNLFVQVLVLLPQALWSCQTKNIPAIGVFFEAKLRKLQTLKVNFKLRPSFCVFRINILLSDRAFSLKIWDHAKHVKSNPEKCGIFVLCTSNQSANWRTTKPIGSITLHQQSVFPAWSIELDLCKSCHEETSNHQTITVLSSAIRFTQSKHRFCPADTCPIGLVWYEASPAGVRSSPPASARDFVPGDMTSKALQIWFFTGPPAGSCRGTRWPGAFQWALKRNDRREKSKEIYRMICQRSRIAKQLRLGFNEDGLGTTSFVQHVLCCFAMPLKKTCSNGGALLNCPNSHIQPCPLAWCNRAQPWRPPKKWLPKTNSDEHDGRHNGFQILSYGNLGRGYVVLKVELGHIFMNGWISKDSKFSYWEDECKAQRLPKPSYLWYPASGNALWCCWVSIASWR